ncbi:MAG: SpoIIAA family protein [Victivallaceae bacterium]
MFEIIATDYPGLVAVKVSDKLTKDEFLQVKTELEKNISQYGKFRFLVEASDLKVPEAGFFVEDFKFIIHNHQYAEKVALIGDKRWEKIWMEFIKLITSVNAIFFDSCEQEKAWKWIQNK